MDRAKTIRPIDLLPARKNGPTGPHLPRGAPRWCSTSRHTEAAIDLARLAGLEPAGVIVEIMNPDGTMARLPELLEMADRFGLRIISIEDLIAYRLAHDTLIERTGTREIDTAYGRFTMTTYRQTTGDGEHFALPGKPDRRRGHSRPGARGSYFDLLHAPAFGRGYTALRKLGGMERCAFVYLENGDHPWSAIHALPETQAVDPSTHDIGEAELKRRQGRTYGLAPDPARPRLRNPQLVATRPKSPRA